MLLNDSTHIHILKMIQIQDWGLIEYNEAWDRQRQLVAEIQQNRNKNVLVLCEHPSVITIGKNGTEKNILFKPEFLKSAGVDIAYTDRGGDVTLHNPGQLVGYPIFNLMDYKQDLHWFLREIELCLIAILSEFAITAERVEGLTGVWIEGIRKISAIGMHCSRWVTSHGFALNVNNDLKEFGYIVPCGITDKQVTSISQELGDKVKIENVKDACIKEFKKRF
jgi:lipoyl(octanoyl) transferase